MTTETSSGRFSMCFNVSSANCTTDFFTNISTAAILQKRNDDLTFININYANCSPSAGGLFAKYSVLSSPASIALKDFLNLNGPIDKNNFTVTNNKSCESAGLLSQSFVSSQFVRLLTEDEFLKLNGVEVELALISATTNACIA
ncbi:MAG: hypothetical protein K8R21_05870 [Leptospira sp.]|nr:hypothetical protein [Leptospira sp.]